MANKVKSTHVLVKFESDYGDEFSIYGFRVMTRENFEEWKKKWKNAVPTHEMYFGTNEWVEFETVAEYKDALTIVDISEEKAKVIEEMFGNSEWGHFMDIVRS